MLKNNTKTIAKITQNGFVKFFDSNGLPNIRHDKSFYRAGDYKKLKNDGYYVIFL
jgi:hypothetical protein